MKKRFSLATAAALVVVSIFAGMEINKLISADNIYEQIKKFGDVLSAAEKSYVDDVDTGKLTDAASPASPRTVATAPTEAGGEVQGVEITDTFTEPFFAVGAVA